MGQPNRIQGVLDDIRFWTAITFVMCGYNIGTGVMFYQQGDLLWAVILLVLAIVLTVTGVALMSALERKWDHAE